MLHRILNAIAVIALVLAPLHAQEKSVKPDINKPFQNPDVDGFMQKFEVESREIFAKRKEIVEACKLKPGMTVADIGAGTGLFTRLFAREVGPKGKVYAVDIAQKFLDHIDKSCKKDDIKNVETVRCSQISTNLPESSVDVAFICDVYHHFEFPQRTMKSVWRALKPGGRLIVIDFKRVKGESSDWVFGHVRAGQEVFSAEIRNAWFTQTEEVKLLKENYLLRFERKPHPNGEKDRPKNKIAKDRVKLTLESVTPLKIEDPANTWVTFHLKIDNKTDKDITVWSSCFSAFDGLTMVYLDKNKQIIHLEPWTQRCSPNSKEQGYALKPGDNAGSINCNLKNDAFKNVRYYQLIGTLPGSPYGHWLESDLVEITKK
ncbi:MAG TPA: methyltransferase domain-containing protein [Edaphobacter sp.]|nr:methyltransferase domain-containing protein [Edaphobacter sp.]